MTRPPSATSLADGDEYLRFGPEISIDSRGAELAHRPGMRGVLLVLPLFACTSTTWKQNVYLDPAPTGGVVITQLRVGSSQRYEVLQEACDTGFDPTGGGDGDFPGVPTNWNISVQIGTDVVAVHKVYGEADDAFMVDALAPGQASLELTGEAGASRVVDLTVVP